MKEYLKALQLVPWTCTICKRDMAEDGRVSHLRGKSHLLKLTRKVARLPRDQREAARRVALTFKIAVAHSSTSRPGGETDSHQKPPAASIEPGTADCTVCDRNIPLAAWADHLHDPTHVRKARLTVDQKTLEDRSRDKIGVIVTQPELDFGIIDIGTLAEWPTRENAFYIRLLDSEGSVLLKNIKLTSQLGTQARVRASNFSVRFSAALTLLPGATYVVKVTFDPEGNRGRYEDRVEFTFQLPLQDNKEFTISRAVTATVSVTAHHQQLAPTAPYTRPKRPPRGNGLGTDGDRPPNFERENAAFCYPLPNLEIPPEILSIFHLQNASVDDKVDLIRQECARDPTYTGYWQTLLWLEECQAE
ncbi:hypothetical protein FS837_005860 [Tulasnella sp. UAMH 9824]|nr:hypothetical protein FS837_005860 [Tulasnella sp. UAMH 9824]